MGWLKGHGARSGGVDGRYGIKRTGLPQESRETESELRFK